MKTIVRSERRRRVRAPRSGFTLIELLVAIAIMAVIAVLSWRGLDQIIRGRQTITNAMEDERVFAQLFDQMRIDARQAASDDESGQPAVSLAGGGLQIVRQIDLAGLRAAFAGSALPGHRRTRDSLCVAAAWRTSAICARRCAAAKAKDGPAVPLMGGVGAISARLYVPRVGWTTQMKDVQGAITEADNNLKVPQLGNAPLPRSVTGLEVSVWREVARAAHHSRFSDRRMT